jgi:YbgC/YbaW family acyl-CoA thioester hydrolase
MKNLGFKLDSRNFMKELPLMVVHSEIDYYFPAGFGDEYEIYTRISKIGRSSITFENIIRLKNGIILAKGSAVLVYFDTNTYQSTPIPENYKNLIINFENEKVEILDY